MHVRRSRVVIALQRSVDAAVGLRGGLVAPRATHLQASLEGEVLLDEVTSGAAHQLLLLALQGTVRCRHRREALISCRLRAEAMPRNIRVFCVSIVPPGWVFTIA